MRRLNLTLALLLIGLGFGCASVDEGQDALVVRAEQTAAVAFDVMDAFVRYEKATPNLGQGAHDAAEAIRKHGINAVESLRYATKAYKQNKSPEGKVTLQTALAFVQALQADAVKYFKPRP